MIRFIVICQNFIKEAKMSNLKTTPWKTVKKVGKKIFWEIC